MSHTPIFSRQNMEAEQKQLLQRRLRSALAISKAAMTGSLLLLFVVAARVTRARALGSPTRDLRFLIGRVYCFSRSMGWYFCSFANFCGFLRGRNSILRVVALLACFLLSLVILAAFVL
mgnify:CR=1 FL=1